MRDLERVKTGSERAREEGAGQVGGDSDWLRRLRWLCCWWAWLRGCVLLLPDTVGWGQSGRSGSPRQKRCSTAASAAPTAAAVAAVLYPSACRQTSPPWGRSSPVWTDGEREEASEREVKKENAKYPEEQWSCAALQRKAIMVHKHTHKRWEFLVKWEFCAVLLILFPRKAISCFIKLFHHLSERASAISHPTALTAPYRPCCIFLLISNVSRLFPPEKRR